MFCTRIDLYMEENIHKCLGCIARKYLKYFHKNSKCIITQSPSMVNIVKNISVNNQKNRQPVDNQKQPVAQPKMNIQNDLFSKREMY